VFCFRNATFNKKAAIDMNGPRSKKMRGFSGERQPLAGVKVLIWRVELVWTVRLAAYALLAMAGANHYNDGL
jgi:hypothetical protein